MISLVRATSDHKDFIELVKFLDAYLAIIDGDEHSFYAQFNKIDSLKNVVIAFENEEAIGCGAFKPFEEDKVEIKRMFVREEARGKKIASQILTELELWAEELGLKHFVLETGIRQSAAVALYSKMGYQIIPNYGQYIGIANSVCFEKKIV
ncbi:MAG: GNAT family N-acetyltransferase [Bacteroidota bacterium]